MACRQRQNLARLHAFLLTMQTVSVSMMENESSLPFTPPAAWGPASVWWEPHGQNCLFQQAGEGTLSPWMAGEGKDRSPGLAAVHRAPGEHFSRGYLTTQGRQPAAKLHRSRPIQCQRPASNVTALLPHRCSLPREQPPAQTGCGLSPNPRGNLLENPGPVSTQAPSKGSPKEHDALSHSRGWT